MRDITDGSAYPDYTQFISVGANKMDKTSHIRKVTCALPKSPLRVPENVIFLSMSGVYYYHHNCYQHYSATAITTFNYYLFSIYCKQGTTKGILYTFSLYLI